MTELWAVSVRGPDDIIPVEDCITAHRVAHRFNHWFVGQVDAHGGLHEFDARMWASPVIWTGDAKQHAWWLANPSPDYAVFINGQRPGSGRAPQPEPTDLDT